MSSRPPSTTAPKGLEIHDGGYEEDGFEIALSDAGYLSIINMQVTMSGRHDIGFCTTYNSKANYPLWAESNEDLTRVFDEDGEFEPEFIELCDHLRRLK